MSDFLDLRSLLESWPYDADNDTRIVAGDDGRKLMQVRTPMGIEQYEMDGRPDGLRPHSAESYLEYQLAMLEAAEAEGRAGSFSLSASDCADLFNEGTIYYFRYVRLFQLRDWKRTMRDTARNLKAFDFIKRYAEREEDQTFLEKWRPYVVRVNATATAMLHIENKAYDQALKTIQAAIDTIEGIEEIDDDTFTFEKDRSLTALKEMAIQVQRDKPISQLEKMERQLRRAIERQEFERAAELRDKIRAAKAKG